MRRAGASGRKPASRVDLTSVTSAGEALAQVELAATSEVLRQRREDAVEDAGARPLLVSPVAGRWRRIPFGHVAPVRSGAQDPQDPVQHLAVVAPRAAAPIGANLRLGDQRLDDRPLSVREIHSSSSAPSVTPSEK